MGATFSSKVEFDPAKDLPDLKGKVVLVTGGSSQGIGYATVQHLARKGAKVYMASRSESLAKEAILRLHREGLGPGNGEVEYLSLDLGDPRKTKASAEAFLAKEKRLDILINNAAQLYAQPTMGPDGIIESMMTNYFGPVVFTNTLLPLLKQTAQKPDNDVRIVVVASDSALEFSRKEVNFKTVEDLNETFGTGILHGQSRYAKSKLANALWAKELQRKLDAEASPIPVVTVHPGPVMTEGVENYPAIPIAFLRSLVLFLARPLFSTASVGAYPSVFAAASPVVKAQSDKYKGAYLRPPCTIGPMELAEDEQRAKDLWSITERMLKQWDV
ncbi:NAD(P)-binding protein [Epithele typhae]|uniref:NAD(P)-binding protein n=1 Tax=Epithele typhae TaxID=378194 RepID=UPI0020078344|nr:NAD(P)-binding protein [Epithele typhae]KAH9941219.1 NAD(P)-binding protein [Epithele typhae]